MSKVTKEQVNKIAQLANLKLTEKEVEKFTLQLSEVIDYNVEKLEEVNTEAVKPLLNISGLANIERKDEPETWLNQEEALKNSKKTHNGFFEVEQILEN